MSDDKLNRIENKLDILSDKIGSIDKTLAAQHESLKDHIRRTEILEVAIKPVVNHVAIIQFIGKVLGILLSSELVYLLIERLRK